MGTAISIISIVLSLIAIILSVILALRQSALQEHSNILATMELFNEWRSQEFKASYGFLLTELANSYPPNNGYDLPESARPHVIRVSHYLDYLGLLVYYNAIRRDLVLGFIGGSITNCWNILSPYIYVERKKRSGPYQEYFENLAALAEKEFGTATFRDIQRVGGSVTQQAPKPLEAGPGTMYSRLKLTLTKHMPMRRKA